MNLILALLILVGRASADNLAVADVSLVAGGQQDMAVQLINPDASYVAFQFDLTLPDGVSIAKNDNNKLMTSLNTDRADDHVMTVKEVSQGVFRFVCYSLSNTVFAGSTGTLVTITLQASEELKSGNMKGAVINQVMTDSNGEVKKWNDIMYNIVIASEAPESEPVLLMETATVGNGSTATATISMENENYDIVAFQFDLTLPEGISIAKNEKGKLMSSLKTERVDDHVMTVKEISTGTYRFVSYSMSNAPYNGKSGALVDITLSATASVGTYEGIISSVVLTEDGNTLHKPGNAKFTIEVVPGVMLGDVNDDGDVDIADAVCIVNYIVGKPNTTFVKAAADVNKDGEVDIADAVGIVNLVVGKIQSFARSQSYKLHEPE